MKNILNIKNQVLEDMLKDFHDTQINLSTDVINKVTEIGMQIAQSIFLVPCVKTANKKDKNDDIINFITVNDNKNSEYLMLFTSFDKFLYSSKFTNKANNVAVLNIFDIACILDDFDDIEGVVINVCDNSFEIPFELFMDLIVLANESKLIGNKNDFDSFYNISEYVKNSKNDINKYKNIITNCTDNLLQFCKENDYINNLYLVLIENTYKNEVFIGISHNNKNEDFFNEIEIILKEYLPDIIVRIDNLRSVSNKRLVKNKKPIYEKQVL